VTIVGDDHWVSPGDGGGFCMRGWMEESAQPPQKPIKTSGPAHFTRCSLQQQHHQGGRRDAPPVPAPPPLRNLHLPPQLPLPLAAARSGPGPKVLLPPPMPKKVPFTVSAHGRSWSDPYHWMRDTSDPDPHALLFFMLYAHTFHLDSFRSFSLLYYLCFFW
jgi:hypothetical protein